MSQHPAISYTINRLLLFAASMGVLYLLGARDLLLVVLAIVISGLLSYVVLVRQRDAMSAAVAARVERTKDRLDRLAAAEDDEPTPDAPDGLKAP